MLFPTESYHQPVLPLLERVHRLMEAGVEKQPGLVKELHEYTHFTRGKKIRAALLFLLAGMNETLNWPEKTARAVETAAALEILHLSSLIHDDIIDRARFRRGRKTFHSFFGNRTSVLWGDSLFIKSLELIMFQEEEIRALYLQTAREMIRGQLLEQEHAFNYDLDAATYFSIVAGKTAALFAMACETPAILAGLAQSKRRCYREFGLDLGAIFQLSDDLLDIFSHKSGKDRFRDLAEGKITMPYIIFAASRGAGMLQAPRAGRKELLSAFREAGIQELTRQALKPFEIRCLEFIHSFPESPLRLALEKLLAFALERDR